MEGSHALHQLTKKAGSWHHWLEKNKFKESYPSSSLEESILIYRASTCLISNIIYICVHVQSLAKPGIDPYPHQPLSGSEYWKTKAASQPGRWEPEIDPCMIDAWSKCLIVYFSSVVTTIADDTDLKRPCNYMHVPPSNVIFLGVASGMICRYMIRNTATTTTIKLSAYIISCKKLLALQPNKDARPNQWE